mmetsp:Transcript_107159/g.245350  ORF Transcript_107159/g.245350 Transcript_107159/m.245350 type:complete len:115 (+) Transcript_107159:682-1026(+)
MAFLSAALVPAASVSATSTIDFGNIVTSPVAQTLFWRGSVSTKSSSSGSATAKPRDSQGRRPENLIRQLEVQAYTCRESIRLAATQGDAWAVQQLAAVHVACASFGGLLRSLTR